MSLLSRIWPPLPVWRRLDLAVLAVAGYTAAVDVASEALDLRMPRWIGDLAVVNGILLGVLLAFRNKEAYERWWEARRQWGQLVNDCRNLCLKIKAAPVPAAELPRLGRLVAGFAVALKGHLRGGKGWPRSPGFEAEGDAPPHVPAHLAGRLFATLRGWRAAGHLTDFDSLVLDPHARSLMDVCGACERIKHTPVPLSYRALLRHGTILYLLSAPWFLAGDYRYWSIAVVALLAYFLLGVELTAEDVEEPFGKDGDDLELGRYCDTIRRSAEDILGVDLEAGKPRDSAA